MTDELLDIYDANMAPIGVADRTRVHAEGLWHRVVHIWLATPSLGGGLIYQLRSTTARSFPGVYDATVGGHLQAGETIESGFREAEEELGIALGPRAAHFLGWRTAVNDEPGGVRNREFQAVFLMPAPEPLIFAPRDGEVAGLAILPNRDGLALHSMRVACAAAQGIDIAGSRAVTLSPESFVPRLPGYYRTMHIMAGRLLAGERDLSV